MTPVMLPAGFPPCVLREGWRLRPDEMHRRTDMDDGSQAVERKLHRMRSLQSVTWELSAAQYDLFWDFVLEDLAAGEAWFLAPVIEGLRTRLQAVRFARMPEASQPQVGHFRIASEVEMREPPRLTLAERVAVEVWLEDGADVAAIIAELTSINAALEGLPIWS